MKEKLEQKIEELKLLIFICESQIKDFELAVTHEAYIKGQKKAYERVLVMFEGIL